jgi:ABC-type multidrug transport system ATPase subunit
LNNKENIVELVDISLSSDTGLRLFENLNLTLAAGETAVITGSTGAGKTSMIELLIGRKKPESGSVMIFGEKINSKNARLIGEIRKRIGGVGGVFQPISYQTVYENMAYPLILRGLKASHRRERVTQVLARLNLLNKKAEKARFLSRGQQVLLMLGRAIVADQPLLLIDEPLAGLDARMAAVVTSLLKRLAVAGHSMIIFTTGHVVLELPDIHQYLIKDRQLR